MPIIDTDDIDDVHDALRAGRPLRSGRQRVLFALNGIDFQPLVLDDPVPLGQQILKAAGTTPVDDHALFVITAEGDFEDVRPDEKVDLRERGVHRFIAFSGDPLYRFKLNDSRIVWGAPAISESILRALACIGDDEAVFSEVRGGTDRLIQLGETVDLSDDGVERFITAARNTTYRFFVNGKPYESDKKKLTGAQIKAMVPGWDPSHDLSLEGQGDEPDRLIADDEAVSLEPKHGVRRFSSVPKANFG